MKVMVNGKEIAYADAKAGNPAIAAAVAAAGYPKTGDAGIVKMSNPFDIFRPQVAAIIGLLFILVIFVTMVYGPIAAMLVELFPTKIRYTSMSLPYHIGNGWFGGLLPATAFAIVASTGDIYAGLWYPIIFATITASSASSSCRKPRTSISRRTDRLAGGDSRPDRTVDQPAADNPRPVLFCQPDAADELQHDLAPMRPRAVLDQIDRLPGAEREFALQHRDLQRGRRQHGLDVRRHVVGPFGVMRPSGILRRETVQCRRQIVEHRRIGVFLDRQRRRGMANEQRHRAFARAGVSTNFATSAVRSVKPAPRRLHRRAATRRWPAR